jgi:uncharacterized protein (DUF58 family)
MNAVRRLAITIGERFDLARFFRGEGPEPYTVTLDRRRIFILPSREGLIFALFLLAMLLGAINYDRSLAFILTFLLASLGMVGMLHTYRNLARLRLAPGQCQPVFAGQVAHFIISVQNPGSIPRYSLQFQRSPGSRSVALDMPPHSQAHAELAVATERRGRCQLGRVTLSSRFPLGLFRSWCYLDPAMQCLVYPQPLGNMPLPPVSGAAVAGHRHMLDSSDDYRGLRPAIPQDPPGHIHWKAAARDQGIYSKQFGGTPQGDLWLRWQQVNALPTEAALSQLCQWVLQAEQLGLKYGLELPGRRLELNSGPGHRHACLTALALYGEN